MSNGFGLSAFYVRIELRLNIKTKINVKNFIYLRTIMFRNIKI